MKIKELRIEHKLSQNELGKIINVSGQTILNWENDIYEPSIEKLIQLADYFNVTLDYLVNRKQSIPTFKIVYDELKKINKEEILQFIFSKITK